MRIENNDTLYKIMRNEMIAYFIVLPGIFMLPFTAALQNDYIRVDIWQFEIIYLSIFALALFFWYGMGFSYIDLNRSNNLIVIKYFKIRPKFMKVNPKMIKIPEKAYSRYVISPSFMGLSKELILYVNTKKGEVAYPPINISSLNQNQLERLKKALAF